MKIQQQVCSLELAKKLKELGVEQKSLFWWNNATRYDGGFDLSYTKNKDNFLGKENYSAFSVAELGEMFPKNVQLPSKTRTEERKWLYSTGETRVIADTEVDARAKMLVYLIENKLITL